MKQVIFAIIIILGIFLRLWQLNTLPGGLFLDEVNIAVDAKTLSQNGVDQYGRHFPFYFEDATDFKLPGYIYITALSYKIFGNQLITVHLPSALSGILSIFLIGYLAKLLFPEKKNIFYFAASILALSPFAIHFSRISYETMFALSFLLLYCISLLHVLKNRHPIPWLFIGSIAILIADWTYPSPRFIIPVFTILLLVLCWVFKFSEIKKKSIHTSLIFIFVVAITFLPTLLFPYADARQLNLLVVDTKGTTLFQSILLKTSSVIASYIRLWNLEFLFDKGDLFAYRHGTKENGVFLLIFVIPYIVGIFWTIQHVTRKNFSLIFLLLLAFVAGLPSALSSEVPYGTRVVALLIPYTLFIALGVHVLTQWLLKQKSFFIKSISLLIGIVLLYQVGLFTYIYFVDFRATSLPEFPTAPVRLATYIKTFHASHPKKAIYFLTDRSCHVWGNDALQLWYFENLPNETMIAWNNTFRVVRYAYKSASPFEAYDRVQIPSVLLPSLNLFLFSSNEEQNKAAKGSLFIRCGYEAATFNRKTENEETLFYMNEEIQQNPFYVVTTKR